MNRTDFLTLPVSRQLKEIEEGGEIVINFLQGNKNISLYKLKNILVKVVSIDGQVTIEVISETEIPRLFQANS